MIDKKSPAIKRGFYSEKSGIKSSDPGETRTHDQWLKRPLLYQLSYRIANIFLLVKKAV